MRVKSSFNPNMINIKSSETSGALGFQREMKKKYPLIKFQERVLYLNELDQCSSPNNGGF